MNSTSNSASTNIDLPGRRRPRTEYESYQTVKEGRPRQHQYQPQNQPQPSLEHRRRHRQCRATPSSSSMTTWFSYCVFALTAAAASTTCAFQQIVSIQRRVSIASTGTFTSASCVSFRMVHPSLAVGGNIIGNGNSNHTMMFDAPVSTLLDTDTITTRLDTDTSTSTPSEGLPDWLQEKVDESMRQQETDDVHLPTVNGGFSHTTSSKAKISAGNKGNTPWNKGKGRSEEVKARIAAGVRKRNREKFLLKLKDMGTTEEEYNQQEATKKAEKEARIKARRTDKGGYRPTEETKAKISKILKDKWATGQVKKRAVDPNKVRRGFTHSEETRAKISASLRKRWADDDEYRAHMMNKTSSVNSSPEIRQRISDTLRKKWENPEFRAEMTAKMAKRSQSSGPHGMSHREKISQSMKAKWKDEAYRKRATEAMKAKQAELTKARPPRAKKVSTATVTLAKKRSAPAKSVTPQPLTATAAAAAAAVVASATNRRAEPLSAPKQKVKGVTSKRVVAGSRTSPKIVEGGDATRSGLSRPPAAKKTRKSVSKKSVSASAVPLLNGATTTKSIKVKKLKKKSKKKDPPGSKTRLREERRDLYDLLYGDDDDGQSPPTNERRKREVGHDSGKDNDDEASGVPAASNSPNRKLASVFLEDDNLDDFDPYGLEDF